MHCAFLTPGTSDPPTTSTPSWTLVYICTHTSLTHTNTYRREERAVVVDECGLLPAELRHQLDAPWIDFRVGGRRAEVVRELRLVRQLRAHVHVRELQRDAVTWSVLRRCNVHVLVQSPRATWKIFPVKNTQTFSCCSCIVHVEINVKAPRE